MSTWSVETVGGGALRRAGAPGGPALWFVHALGDSSFAFLPLFSPRLTSQFELFAPDLPGAGLTPLGPHAVDLDVLAEWLARAIQQRSAGGYVGVVGHSLGSAIGVRAVRRIQDRALGVFSIEGNLTEADAYLSGEAMAFQSGETFQDHLLHRVRTLAEGAGSASSRALWRYYASMSLATPDALLGLGRSASAASAGDGLGAEYRALAVPNLYYWSPANTPVATREYIHRHALCNRSFGGGHWPMIEDPDTTTQQIASFFEPLVARRSE